MDRSKALLAQAPERVKDIIVDLRREMSEKLHRKAGAHPILWAIEKHPELLGLFQQNSGAGRGIERDDTHEPFR